VFGLSVIVFGGVCQGFLSYSSWRGLVSNPVNTSSSSTSFVLPVISASTLGKNSVLVSFS